MRTSATVWDRRVELRQLGGPGHTCYTLARVWLHCNGQRVIAKQEPTASRQKLPALPARVAAEPSVRKLRTNDMTKSFLSSTH